MNHEDLDYIKVHEAYKIVRDQSDKDLKEARKKKRIRHAIRYLQRGKIWKENLHQFKK